MKPVVSKNLFDMGDSILTVKQGPYNQCNKVQSANKVSEFMAAPDEERNTNTEEKKMLGKRANRGYNPKYDTNETQFICKNDSTKQVMVKQESGKKSYKIDNMAE